MATKNFTGTLRDPASELAVGDKLRFIHKSTTGETISGATSELEIPASGMYSINLEYGLIQIDYYDVLSRRWTTKGIVTVNADTTVTTIPALLNAVVPASDPVLIQMQQYMSDAQTAETNAEGFADDAAASAAGFDVAIASWDVDIPFNDGLDIERGYGASGKTVTYSGGGATNINKSGVVEALSVDEVSIGKDGIAGFEAVTNEILQSNDLTQASWTTPSTGASFGSQSPELNNSASRHETNVINDCSYGQAVDFVSGHVSVSCYVKADTSSSLTIRTLNYDTDKIVRYDLSTVTANDTHGYISHVGNGWYRCSLIYQLSGTDTSGFVYYYLATDLGKNYASSVGNSIYFYGAMTSDTPFLAPYIPTTTAAVTRPADNISIPMMGNMPAAGESFTIVVDAVTPANIGFLLESSGITDGFGIFLNPQVDGFRLRKKINNVFSYYSSGIDITPFIGLKKRYCIRYNNGTLTFFIDGTKGNDSNVGDLVFDMSSNIKISMNGVDEQNLNSYLKNFKIIHRALSDAEIAALGGPS